jgi:Flp pilus assembly protein TadD
MSLRLLCLSLSLAALSGCSSSTDSTPAKLTAQTVLNDCKKELDIPDYPAAGKDCLLADLWLQREQPDSLVYADAQERLADLLVRNNIAAGISKYQAALDLREKLADTGPELDSLRLKQAKALSFGGKWPETEALLKKILPATEAAKGKESADTAEIYNRIGVAQLQQKNAAEAEKNLSKALEILQAQPSVDTKLLAEVNNNLGYLKQLINKPQEAENYYQKAVQTLQSQKDIAYPQLFEFLNNLAELQKKQGENKQADENYNQLIGVAEKGFGNPSLQYAAAQNNLGMLALFNHNYNSAENLLGQARLTREKLLGINNIQTAETAYSQALALAGQGKISQAIPLMRYSVAFTELALGQNNPQVQQRWKNLAALQNGAVKEVAQPANDKAAEKTANKKAKK